MTNTQYFAIAAAIFYAANAPKHMLTLAFWVAITDAAMQHKETK